MSNANGVNGNGNGNAAAAAKEAYAARLAAARAAKLAAAQAEKVVKTDTVELSKKSVALAETTLAKIDPKVEAVNKQVTATEKSQDQRQNARQAMRENQQELRKLVKGLKRLGMGSREVSKIVKTANRNANKVVGKEVKQAYNDFRSHKINKQSFYNKLYGAAVKKLDGLVSALRNAYEQKQASAESQTVTVEPIEVMDPPKPIEKADDAEDKNAEAVKENANATKSDEATQATKETRVTDADDAAKANAEKSTEATKEASKVDDDDEKKIPPGLAKKEGVPPGQAKKAAEEAEATASTTVVAEEIAVLSKTITAAFKESGIISLDGNQSPDQAFAEIVDFFNEIDKMINGFAVEAEGNGDKGEDKGDSLLNFASRLSDMFSGINKAFGNRSNGGDVGHKLGMAQVRKETIGQLFNSGNGSGAINRIGDAGEGSGNFNAVRFMSSLSNGINEGLESYKDIQKAEKESKGATKEEFKEEAVSTVA